ncbi:hypothetical protein BBJ28_00018957 [Nothophytophthora sp. Chile5]|nr:hypothetical protein BBJ28_00018957 [Nothophytophthora sp. Chile5]
MATALFQPLVVVLVDSSSWEFYKRMNLVSVACSDLRLAMKAIEKPASWVNHEADLEGDGESGSDSTLDLRGYNYDSEQFIEVPHGELSGESGTQATTPTTTTTTSLPSIMSVYTKFAIVGAGGVGGVTADELLKKGATVTILTRDDSKVRGLGLQAIAIVVWRYRPELDVLTSTMHLTRGATLSKVDYDDEDSLKKALSGSEVACQYGVAVTEGPNTAKKVIQDLLKEVGLPFTLHSCCADEYYCDACFVPPSNSNGFMGYNFEEGYMTVVGKGETPFSITSRTDVGRFVAHVLSTTPKSELAGAKLPFEAERLSPLQIAALAEKKFGKKMEIRYVDYEENKKNFNTDFMAFLTTLFEDGRGCPGTEQEMKATVAKYFPDWNPAPYESFLV